MQVSDDLHVQLWLVCESWHRSCGCGCGFLVRPQVIVEPHVHDCPLAMSVQLKGSAPAADPAGGAHR